MAEEEEAALSDDEIEALLDEEDVEEASPEEATPEGKINLDELLEAYEDLSVSVQNVFSTILNRTASQTIETLDFVSPGDMEDRFDDQPEKMVVISSELSGTVKGTAYYLLNESDALILADVMMGEEGDDPPDEFDDVYESAIVEMFNQIVNSQANQINDMIDQPLELSAPESEVCTREEALDKVRNQESLWVEYTFEVEDLIDSGRFLEIQPRTFGEMIWESRQEEPEEEPPSEPSEQEPDVSQQTEETEDQTEVKSVEFQQFEATEAEEQEGSMNMLMDVPMEVAVELGRTKLQVKEILNLGQGSIIELERLAGEPVDLLVNGKLVARGEVVVIDESFGVRVTSIVSPMDRIQ